jgi:hypothetical protein
LNIVNPGSKEISNRNVKALLLVGALYAREDCFNQARELLVKEFGPTMLETEPRPWDHTDYYGEELGPDILRRFLFFREPIGQGELAEIKVATIAIEKGLSEGGRRTVNLDPGYMTPAKLVLASTKDYSHRVYLGRGVFAEVALAYVKNDGFKPFPYTYRDYCNAHYLKLFDEVRERAKELIL